MNKTLVAGVLAVLAVTTTACGNDEATAANSISDSLMSQQKQTDSQLLTLKKDDADCIGKGWVDKIGTDKLQKYGVLNQDMKVKGNGMSSVKMAPADADKAADVVMGCTDVKALMDKAMANSVGIDPKVKACVDNAFTKRAAHDMFASLFEGNRAQATSGLTAKLMQCVTGTAPSG